MKEIVFATNNPHKLEEARRIAGASLRIISLEELGCHEEIPETSPTLAGNALQKAHWVKEHYGYDCFADDTGLMVDALDGAPGVLSARFAGEHCSPDDNMTLLLSRMEGVKDRHARFSGSVEGSIATERDGNAGFGYDPVFIAKESGRSFASMSADEKNAISHRGRAMRAFMDYLLANN
jgi:XTP/dITP diphosphohydrolase